MKIYRARTNYSTSIQLPSGKYKYVIFDSESDGTSTLRVTSSVISEALEKKKEFGSVFYLESGGESKPDIEAVKEGDKAIGSAGAEKTYKEIKVESWEDAKRILVEEYGYPANKVRTQSQIQRVAASEGINFIM